MVNKITKKPDNNYVWRDSYYHKLFGLKAAKEAARVLPLFEKAYPKDKRPSLAITAIKNWSEGKQELNMALVRKLSLDSHAAARMAKTEPAKYAARAAGQAVATWHVPTHALATFNYAAKAIAASKNKLHK